MPNIKELGLKEGHWVAFKVQPHGEEKSPKEEFEMRVSALDEQFVYLDPLTERPLARLLDWARVLNPRTGDIRVLSIEKAVRTGRLEEFLKDHLQEGEIPVIRMNRNWHGFFSANGLAQ